LDEVIHLIRHGNIRWHGEALAPDLFDISRRRLQGFGPAAGEGHVGPGPREGETHGPSQTRSATGHHRFFIREGKSFENHTVLLCCTG
jgi:hypothetical protein